MHAVAECLAAVAIAVMLSGVMLGQTAEPESGSVCVAPVPEKPDKRSAPGLFCESEKLSFKIDTQPAASFPFISEQRGTYRIGKRLRVDGLDTAARHRVVVYCNGKPQQSFTFRFSEFKTRQLCLFLNSLYKTAQLWDAKQCPWCKCN